MERRQIRIEVDSGISHDLSTNQRRVHVRLREDTPGHRRLIADFYLDAEQFLRMIAGSVFTVEAKIGPEVAPGGTFEEGFRAARRYFGTATDDGVGHGAECAKVQSPAYRCTCDEERTIREGLR